MGSEMCIRDSVYVYVYVCLYVCPSHEANLLQDVKTRSKHSGEDVIYGMSGLNEDVICMYIYIICRLDEVLTREANKVDVLEAELARLKTLSDSVQVPSKVKISTQSVLSRVILSTEKSD